MIKVNQKIKNPESFKAFLGLDWMSGYFISSGEMWFLPLSLNFVNLQVVGLQLLVPNNWYSYLIQSSSIFLNCSHMFGTFERFDAAMCSAIGLWSNSFMWIFGLNPIWVKLSNFEYWVLFNVMRFVVHLFENIQNNRKYSIKSRLVVPWNGSKPSESDLKPDHQVRYYENVSKCTNIVSFHVKIIFV